MAGFTRLRWRLRGAWQWPTFAATLIGDTLLLHWLPAVGDGAGPAPALLLALLFNLVVVAVVAPALGVLVRRRRSDLPRIVAVSAVATTTMLVLTAGLAIGGILHRPAVQAARRAFAAQAAAVRGYVRTQAVAYERGLAHAEVALVQDGLYRTCVPGPSRWLCLIIDTTVSPPGVTVDPDSVPGSSDQ